ncbi:hypothetical protein RDWZM_003554 [Blomia tropicalis]|uniref:Uncharacterized protein n=1 Tax=Blomia tropicalis TaxID=40697 RepID=A0A9Q0RSN1_BLOTA|nr:hypothetical protein RDWZM_003554 [Blomia tropicalis]
MIVYNNWQLESVEIRLPSSARVVRFRIIRIVVHFRIHANWHPLCSTIAPLHRSVVQKVSAGNRISRTPEFALYCVLLIYCRFPFIFRIHYDTKFVSVYRSIPEMTIKTFPIGIDCIRM